eukprot:674170-Pelagomonas_calceolata.AAC.1
MPRVGFRAYIIVTIAQKRCGAHPRRARASPLLNKRVIPIIVAFISVASMLDELGCCWTGSAEELADVGCL